MKAMVLRKQMPVEALPLRLEDVPRPRISSDQLLVRITACGICHTDLHIVEGELPAHRLPLIPGHQVIGTVEQVGESVKEFEVGDRAGVAWLNSTCGTCRFCRAGLENLCEKATFTGYDVDGGYAEYITISEDFAYKVPPGLADLQAAPLLCAGIIGYRAFKLTKMVGGQNLGLFGFGASAHIVIQIAVHAGCRVYVFSRSAEHRKLAETLGATWTGTPADQPPEKLNGAIIFAPAGELVPVALENLERGGTLTLAGIYMTQVPTLDYSRHLYFEKKITSVTASTRQDGAELLKLASQIPIRTEVQLFQLQEANKALALLKQGKLNGAGVLKIAS